MKLEKKTHKNSVLTHKNSAHLLQFGNFGFKNKNFQRITQSEIHALEWIIKKYLKKFTNKKVYKFWNLINLNLTLTKLSLESRMGKGKGSIFSKASFINPGVILFEFDNLTIWQVKNLALYFKKKSSLKFSVISRTKPKIGRETQR